jgi:hypothetical protein
LPLDLRAGFNKQICGTLQKLTKALRDLVGVHVNLLHQFGQGVSLLSAFKATFALNVRVWWRRGHLVMVSPVRGYWPPSGRESTHPRVAHLWSIKRTKQPVNHSIMG